MRRPPSALLALLSLWPLAARAEEKVRVDRLGASLEFTMPTGWSKIDDDDGVTFVSPVLTSGQVIQIVFNVRKRVARTPNETVVAVAEVMKKQLSGIQFDAPFATTFVDLPGASVAFKRAQAGFAIVGQIVAAHDGDRVYYFFYSGLSSDVMDAEFQKGASTLKKSGRKLQQAALDKTRAPKVTGPRREIRDPAWGLEVKGLGEGWKIGVEPDGYVLFSARPQATVILQRLTDAETDKQLQRGRPVTGTFGGQPAAVLEGTNAEGARQRSFYLRAPGRVIAVHFASVTFAEAESLLAQVQRSLKLFSPVVEQAPGGGLGLELPHGLTLRLPRPWAIGALGPEHAAFHGPEGTTVRVRVMRLEANEEDPFQDERYTNRRTCALYDMQFDERDVAVPGASRARRFQCQGKGRAALLYLLEGRSAGSPVYVSVVAYYDKRAGKTPDGVAADFLSHLGMPR